MCNSMKKIKLSLSVNYEVNLIADVSDEVFDALKYAQDRYVVGFDYGDADQDTVAAKAFDWITDNCNEKDSSSWRVEIDEVIERMQ